MTDKELDIKQYSAEPGLTWLHLADQRSGQGPPGPMAADYDVSDGVMLVISILY